MSNLPEAGVGMIYLPGLEKLLESHLHLLHVVEIEPQTLWYNKNANCDSFNFNLEQTRILQEYPVNKLFHSVGFPIGSTHFPGIADLDLLKQHADLIKPLWVSEHLSFNTFEENGQLINTNFLLPPLQTQEGIAVAVKAIQHFKSSINLPFAFETGVNYLQPQSNEIPDGSFVAEIARQADCHILLDLHNIMANQINGRQPVDEFIRQLPLERVCEIHIAGGFFYNNYYLDGHSGVSNNELFQILDKTIRQLPCAKALIFEMLPEYVNSVSNEALTGQLEQMHRIWENRGKDHRAKQQKEKITTENKTVTTEYTARDWENNLGKMVTGQPVPASDLTLQLENDKGIQIINELIFHFRASMLVTALKLTTRLLRLSLGTEVLNEDLKTFFAGSSPELFPFAAAQKFTLFLQEKNYPIRWLNKLLEFELASLQTMVDDQPRSIEFDYNPFPVFRALSNNQPPEEQDKEMVFIVKIEPDELVGNNDSFNFYSVYHN